MYIYIYCETIRSLIANLLFGYRELLAIEMKKKKNRRSLICVYLSIDKTECLAVKNLLLGLSISLCCVKMVNFSIGTETANKQKWLITLTKASIIIIVVHLKFGHFEIEIPYV